MFNSKILIGVLTCGILTTAAFASDNKGFKYFNKYIKKTAHLKSTELLNVTGAKSQKDLYKLFENNATLLIKKLNDANLTKASKGVQKIIKKGKLKDLEDFLKGIMQGKIPAGC